MDPVDLLVCSAVCVSFRHANGFRDLHSRGRQCGFPVGLVALLPKSRQRRARMVFLRMGVSVAGDGLSRYLAVSFLELFSISFKLANP